MTVTMPDPKDSLADPHLRGRALALDMSSWSPASTWPTSCWPDQKPGRIVSCLITVLPHGDRTQVDADLGTPRTSKENTVHSMLADQVDYVIGVDTHRDSNTAAVVDASTGAALAHMQCPTDAMGYRRCYNFGTRHGSGRRVWAIEGSGSFGSGLTTFLLERGEWVVEIDRPARPARRNGAKNDELDAIRAAREALSREHLAAPRARGNREALRVLLTARQGAIVARTKAIGQLKALIVNAPQALREQMRRGSTNDQLERGSRLRTLPTHSVEHRTTVRAIRAVARRALFLEAEAAEHESAIEELVMTICPSLLELPGVGAVTAAQFIVSWSHPGRVRNEAAFASLAGVAPIPASSGATVRHRLNRSGDRQLNRALYTVALSRLQHHPETKAYAARRTREGKTPREIKRCLKRAIARQIYRHLEAHATGLHQLPHAA
jgi:transposase